MANDSEANNATKEVAQPAARTRLTTRVRDWLPLVMSILAFTVSITSLYYAALRSGSVTAMTGPMVILGHHPVTGATNVSVAVNLSNVGARLITTRELQLVVTAPDGATSVTLPAVAQQQFDATGEPQDDSMVAPITLAPRSETTRQLRFTTRRPDVERFNFFDPGIYRFVLWLAVANRPALDEAEKWSVTVDDIDAGMMQTRYEMGVAWTVAVLKDQQ